MPSNVTMRLQGLLILFAKVGEPRGKVAIIKTHPQNHDLTIKVTKSTGQQIVLTRNQIQNNLSLQIVTSTVKNNTIRNNNPVDRKGTPENDSFNWFVDFERPSELYKPSIGVDPDGVEPVLTFDSGGELFTVPPLSQDFLKIQDGFLGTPTDLGRVALTLGVDFPGTTSVIFKNGASEVFNSNNEPNTNYKIEIIHDATQHGPIVTDANFYYTALGTGINESKRKLFMSMSLRRQLAELMEDATKNKKKDLVATIKQLLAELGPPVGPEAACFPAYVSQTPL